MSEGEFKRIFFFLVCSKKVFLRVNILKRESRRKFHVLLDMGYTGPQKTIFIAQISKPKNMLENIITEEEWTIFLNFGPT